MWSLHFSCFFSHGKNALFLGPSSSFDFVVTEHFILKSKCRYLQYSLILFYYVCIRFFHKYMLTDSPQLARLLVDQSVKNQIVNSIIDSIIKLKLKYIIIKGEKYDY